MKNEDDTDEPVKMCGYGNALVFDLATWRDRISPNAIVPGASGPFTFGHTRGYILYAWDGKDTPPVSAYDPREYGPVEFYLKRWKREKQPAAVAACVSWHRVQGEGLPAFPFMLDVKDVEFYRRKNEQQHGVVSSPEMDAKRDAEAARLEAGFRETSHDTPLCAEVFYVTSELHADTYARLSEPGTWTMVGERCPTPGDPVYDRRSIREQIQSSIGPLRFTKANPRSSSVAKVLHALGLASAEYLAWLVADDDARDAIHAGGDSLCARIDEARSHALERGEQPVGPRAIKYDYYGGQSFDWPGSDD